MSLTERDLAALARIQILADIDRAKSDWYRLRKAGRVQGPLERHHDRWLWLVERVDAWDAPSGAPKPDR